MARKNEALKTQIVKNGFYKIADDTENVKKVYKKIYLLKSGIQQGKFEKIRSVEEQAAVDKLALEKGIVRIAIDDCVTW